MNHELNHFDHHDHFEHDHHDHFENHGCGHHDHPHIHHDIFPPNYHLIDNEHELKHILTELFIRFDGKSGSYLSDDDFRLLTKLLAQSLIYLYKRDHHVATVIRVDKLPPFHHAEIGAIYMIPNPDGEPGKNEFVEYIFVGDHYELLGGEGGSAPIDFSIEREAPIKVVEDPINHKWTIGIEDSLMQQINNLDIRVTTLEEKVNELETDFWTPINF